MEKLSKSMASKRYLENKYGKSQPISDEMQKQLEQAGTIANEKIELNNTVYNQSNSHAHEAIIQEETSNQNSEFETLNNQLDTYSESLETPIIMEEQGPKLIKR